MFNLGSYSINTAKNRIYSGEEQQQQQLLQWRQQVQVSSEDDMLGLGIIFHFTHSYYAAGPFFSVLKR